MLLRSLQGQWLIQNHKFKLVRRSIQEQETEICNNWKEFDDVRTQLECQHLYRQKPPAYKPSAWGLLYTLPTSWYLHEALISACHVHLLLHFYFCLCCALLVCDRQTCIVEICTYDLSKTDSQCVLRVLSLDKIDGSVRPSPLVCLLLRIGGSGKWNEGFVWGLRFLLSAECRTVQSEASKIECVFYIEGLWIDGCNSQNGCRGISCHVGVPLHWFVFITCISFRIACLTPWICTK